MDDGSAATHIPDFDLPASTGRNLSLDSFLDKVPLAIVFLTDLEADRALLDELNEAFPQFGEIRAQVLAVAPTTAVDLRRFIDANDIAMPVLADASGTMARDFGAFDETGNPALVAVVATPEGRQVARLDVVADSDLAERLLNELRDLHTGANVDLTAEE